MFFINIIYALEKAMGQRITEMNMYSLLETVVDLFFSVFLSLCRNTLGQGTFI